MALNIDGFVINNTRVSPPDGSTAARAARSGADLARN